eukprot:g4260.t1
MDARRRIIKDGAIGITADRITFVGKRQQAELSLSASEIIDGSDFVITPGFIDGHVHITGDPLTRSYVPDEIDVGFEEKLNDWVIPRYYAHNPEDERLSAQLSALEMLHSGTTCFVEAGTVRHLDAAVDGLKESGIRGRVGSWVEGRAFDPSENQTRLIDTAIKQLEDEVAKYPTTDTNRISAWPLLVGHNTNPDEVWRAAKKLADDNHLGISAHMTSIAGVSYIGHSLWMLYLAYACIGIAGAITSPVMFTKVIAGWFDKTRGLFLGIAGGLGNGLGSALTPLLIMSLITAYGWRGGYQGLALTILIIGFPTLFLLLWDPPRLIDEQQKQDQQNVDGLTLKQAMNTSTFWMILIAVGLVAGCMTALFAHLIPMLVGRGLEVSQATTVLIAFSLVTAAWQIGVGRKHMASLVSRLAVPIGDDTA